MRKFILNIGVLLIVFFVAVVGLELLFKDYQNFVSNHFDDYYSKSDEVEVVVLGNSHIQALGTPEVCGLKIFNFGFGGQDIFHMYAIIKKILQKPNKIKHILVGLDYDLLGYNYKVANTLWLDRLYYDDTKLLYDSSLANLLMANLNFFKANRSISNLNVAENGNTIDQNSFVTTGTCEDRAHEHSLIKFDTKYIDENVNFLKRIIHLCRERNISLTFVNMPKTTCYYRSYSNKTINIAKKEITSLLKNSSIKFIDLWESPKIQDSLFIDFDHINPKYNKYFFKNYVFTDICLSISNL